MNFTEKNRETLLNHHPYLAGFMDRKPDDRLEFQMTASGFMTAKLNGTFLHSSHNPLKEAANLIYTKVDKELTSCVFYGFGLGYLVESFLDAFPGIKAVIVEPDPGLFLKALESRDLTRILSSPGVAFFMDENPENLIFICEQLPLLNVQIVKLRSVYGKDENYYKSIDGVISSYLSRKEVNVNTIKRFGRLWVTNLVKNIALLIDKPGIAGLTDSFAGMPALVLASGPSLNALQPGLKELSRRMLIISVDTSLRVCMNQGVEPDFLIVVDPQYWNTRHIDWQTPAKTLIVSESSTHPRIFRQLNLDGYFASSYFPLGQFFESEIGEKGKIGAGGSVATAAWDFARLTGASPICMGGLDLGFPGRQTHFKGAFFENAFLTWADRFTTAESASHRYLFQADPFLTASNDGKPVMTDRRMSIFKWWFENQMKQHGSVVTYNLSSHGVRIEGMPAGNIETFLSLPVIRPDIDRRMNLLRESFKREKETGTQRAALKKSIQALCADLGRLREISDQGISQVLSIKNQYKRGRISPGELEKLNRIDEKIVNSSSRQIVSFLLQAIIQEIIHCSTQKKDPDQILDSNLRVYEELKESCSFHLNLLKRAEASL